MKKLLKIAALAFCAVALVVASVLGTLAYLQATSGVAENTFTVGNIEISLDEAKVDEYGVPVEGADRVLKNEYKLIPGHSYTKDPTVVVEKGSEVCYVRMLVTITEMDKVRAVYGDDFLPQDFVGSTWDSEKWITTGVVTEKDNACTYEFRYYTAVDASEGDVTLPALFEKIVIDDSVSETQLETLKDMKITVVAHAIQEKGFADADAAWASWAD